MARIRFITLVALLVAARPAYAAPSPGFSDYRALFVNRFEYSYNAGSINSIMQNAADLGITDVMFQVRGRADAFYDSAFEPRANGLPANFDPLQTAIDAAHSRGLKLHAWMNATPMWNSTAINPPAGHIFHNTNPSFRLMDSSGVLEPQVGWSNYSSVNPVLPEVHTHINNVVDDIATNYAVDGVHLDYIRYLPGNSFARLPHDPIAHQMFQAATGLDGANAANTAAYRNFVKGRITDLVGSIKQTVDAAEVSEGRTIELTASVWRDPDVGENDYMQDYRTWLENDLLDIAMPMIYLSASNDQLFNPNLLNSLNIPTNSRVAPILGVYLHGDNSGGVALTRSQLERAYNLGADGVGFYAYTALFNEALAGDRRATISDFFEGIENPPPPPPPGVGNVLDNFEVDEGHFNWPYNQSPQTTGLAATTVVERLENPALALAGIGSQRISLQADVADGNPAWAYRHNSGIGLVANPAGNVPLAATGHVGMWLKTGDLGVTVQLAIDDPVSGNTALEKGTPQEVIGDNLWHLYQWNLENEADWLAFAGGANGQIDAPSGNVSIDSIFFSGSGNVLMHMDNVSHNPLGPLGVPEPSAGWIAGVLAAILLLYAIRESRRMARVVP